MARSAILLIQDDHVACIERRRAGMLYYIFPGGSIEPGESVEQAAIREAKEELGLDVELGPLAASLMFGEREQSYFWASAIGGEFGSGQGPEFASPPDSAKGSYKPVWLPIATLSEYNVRPPVLAHALFDGTLSRGQPALSVYEEPAV